MKAWNISTDTHYIQAAYTRRGRDLLEAMRDSLPEYKQRYITMSQKFDPKIQWGREYEYGKPIEDESAKTVGVRAS